LLEEDVKERLRGFRIASWVAANRTVAAMGPFRSKPPMDTASGASALRRRAAHGTAGDAGIRRSFFFEVFLGNTGSHGLLKVNILGRAFADIGAAEAASFCAAARRTGCMPIAERAPRRAAA
jgi:hypothetical protein